MAVGVLRLPDIKRKTETRPKRSPYCGGETFQHWGSVKDLRVRTGKVPRAFCCHYQRVVQVLGCDPRSDSQFWKRF